MSEKFLNMENFDNEINNSEKLVLVDFYATWCGPCKMLAPVLENIAEEYQDKINVYKVNVDEEMELARKFNIASIPTLIFFKDGKVAKTLVGLVSKSDLQEEINTLL